MTSFPSALFKKYEAPRNFLNMLPKLIKVKGKNLAGLWVPVPKNKR